MTHHKIKQHLEKALDLVHKMEAGSGMAYGMSGGKKHHSRRHRKKGGDMPSSDDSCGEEDSGKHRHVGFKLYNKGEGMAGEGMAYGMAGGSKRKRHSKKHSHKRGSGISGGKKTNKRAQIVKKVMKEHGMKMIEASKYVKQHGLY